MLRRMFIGIEACAIAMLYAVSASAQTTTIDTEYLMTLYAPIEAPQAVNGSLLIFNALPGGEVYGPKINGTLIAPAGDWGRIMPGGQFRLDVRLTIQTDDGSLIYCTYNGVIMHTQESYDRLMQGEQLKTGDFYFMTAPTFETSSENYAWLNGVQTVGKMVAVKLGEGSFVKYDIFIVK